MIFPIFGGECAPGLLDARPVAEPGIVTTNADATDLVRLFALDRAPISRRRLFCHWRRQSDGRLACLWEPDIVLVPQR
jgi:hypothetical protein